MRPATTERDGFRRATLPSATLDLAAAMAGDRTSLAKVAADHDLAARVSRQRIAPLLARRARAAGIDTPITEGWRRVRTAVAANWLLAEHMTGLVGDALGAAGIPWAPIKGADLAFRVHETPEDRPATDLDILVDSEHRAAAVAALKQAGWFDRWGDDPEMWRFVLEEGHNWPLVRREGVMVEVHFRLWGFMPPDLGALMMARARPDPGLGSSARRLAPADAILLSASHAWTETVGEPPIRTLYDIHRLLTASAAEVPPVTGSTSLLETAAAAGLSGAVGASLRLTAALWPSSPAGQMATSLIRRAPYLERHGCRRMWPSIGHRSAFSVLVLLRLLCRQPSRLGWKSVGRRLLPHRGLRRHRPADPLGSPAETEQPSKL